MKKNSEKLISYVRRIQIAINQLTNKRTNVNDGENLRLFSAAMNAAFRVFGARRDFWRPAKLFPVSSHSLLPSLLLFQNVSLQFETGRQIRFDLSESLLRQFRFAFTTRRRTLFLSFRFWVPKFTKKKKLLFFGMITNQETFKIFIRLLFVFNFSLTSAIFLCINAED